MVKFPRVWFPKVGRAQGSHRPKRLMYIKFNLFEGGGPYEQIKIYSRVKVDVSMTARTPNGSATRPSDIYLSNLFYSGE